MTGLFGILFWSCLVVYAVAVATQIYGQVFQKPAWVRIATAAVWLGCAAIGATSLAMKCERVIEVSTWMCEVWFKNEMPR